MLYTLFYLSDGSRDDAPEAEVGGGARSSHGVGFTGSSLPIGHDCCIEAIQHTSDQLTATATVNHLLTGIVENLYTHTHTHTHTQTVG